MELSLLQQGGFKIWAEEAFPMTPGQRSDRMAEIMSNPQSYPFLSLVDDPMVSPMIVPQNLPTIQETLMIEGMENPKLNTYNLLLETIQQLLQGAPQPPMVDPYTMQPMGPPTPSIQPDMVVFDDPTFVIRVVGDWYRKELSQMGGGESQANPNGMANVRAYLETWMMIVQQQQMAAQMAMAPPPGAGGPSGGGGREGSGSTEQIGEPPLPTGPPPVPQTTLNAQPMPSQPPLG
jgi:hypothetical protein